MPIHESSSSLLDVHFYTIQNGSSIIYKILISKTSYFCSCGREHNLAKNGTDGLCKYNQPSKAAQVIISFDIQLSMHVMLRIETDNDN